MWEVPWQPMETEGCSNEEDRVMRGISTSRSMKNVPRHDHEKGEREISKYFFFSFLDKLIN